MIDLGVLAYPTPDAAAIAALALAYDCGELRRECGGVIYEYVSVDGRKYYYFSYPETSNKSFSVEIKALTETPPPRFKMVGDYHNHICSVHNKPFAAFFSVGDVLSNVGFHNVGYLLDGCTGNISRLDPTQDPTDDEEVVMTSGRTFYLASGHIVGWIPVLQESYYHREIP